MAVPWFSILLTVIFATSARNKKCHKDDTSKTHCLQKQVNLEGLKALNSPFPPKPVAISAFLTSQELEALDAERIPSDGNWGGIKATLKSMGRWEISVKSFRISTVENRYPP